MGITLKPSPCRSMHSEHPPRIPTGQKTEMRGQGSGPTASLRAGGERRVREAREEGQTAKLVLACFNRDSRIKTRSVFPEFSLAVAKESHWFSAFPRASRAWRGRFKIQKPKIFWRKI